MILDFPLEAFPRHAGPPLIRRLDLDRRLKHRHRRGIGRRFRRARLAEDGHEFRDLFQADILLMQNPGGFLRAEAIGRGRHEKKIAFVERRHEFAAQTQNGNDGKGEQAKRENHHQPACPQHPIDDGMIERDENAVDRVARLGSDAPPNKRHHQDRNQRDGEQRGEEHGEGLGEGQRLKKPSRLSFQREDRNEGNRDDQQRKEERAAHLPGGVQDGFDSFLIGQVSIFGRSGVLQLLVGIFDHDDRRIDHGADGNGNAAQRHDVCGQVHRGKRDERKQNRRRQHDDRDQRAAQMPEKDERRPD